MQYSLKKTEELEGKIVLPIQERKVFAKIVRISTTKSYMNNFFILLMVLIEQRQVRIKLDFILFT